MTNVYDHIYFPTAFMPDHIAHHDVSMNRLHYLFSALLHVLPSYSCVHTVDNVLWCDRVHRQVEYADPDTEAIRSLNDTMATDDRIELAFLPTADGVALCYKK